MEQRTRFAWLEPLILALVLLVIYEFTSVSSHAMIQHAHARRARVKAAASR